MSHTAQTGCVIFNLSGIQRPLQRAGCFSFSFRKAKRVIYSLMLSLLQGRQQSGGLTVCAAVERDASPSIGGGWKFCKGKFLCLR